MHVFRFQKGPIFTNLLLADEINRATPKTQSALLEAMEEHTVTVGGKPHKLDEPFFVLATQNPIEQEGTYPLPEAQLDKFIFKLIVPFPDGAALEEIIVRTTTEQYPSVSKVAHAGLVEEMKAIAREVPVASHVEDFAASLIVNSWPRQPARAQDRQGLRLARLIAPRPAGPDPGGQSAGAAGRPLPRQFRGRSRRGRPRASPSHPAEPGGRSKRRQD